MTELETIQHAKNYLDKMAQGINPFTNEPIPDEELLNNVRISRCLFFTSGILGKVLENGGIFPPAKENLPPFSIDYALLANFPYSSYPLSITHIAGRISDLVPANTVKRLTYAPIAKWLMENGYLHEITINGKKRKQPTQAGQQIGISTQQREGQNGSYVSTVYDINAQRFIVEHLPEILENYAADE